MSYLPAVSSTTWDVPVTCPSLPPWLWRSLNNVSALALSASSLFFLCRLSSSRRASFSRSFSFFLCFDLLFMWSLWCLWSSLFLLSCSSDFPGLDCSTVLLLDDDVMGYEPGGVAIKGGRLVLVSPVDCPAVECFFVCEMKRFMSLRGSMSSLIRLDFALSSEPFDFEYHGSSDSMQKVARYNNWS